MAIRDAIHQQPNKPVKHALFSHVRRMDQATYAHQALHLIRFCHTGPISLCIDLFVCILCVFVLYCIVVVWLWAWWGEPDGIESDS